MSAAKSRPKGSRREGAIGQNHKYCQTTWITHTLFSLRDFGCFSKQEQVYSSIVGQGLAVHMMQGLQIQNTAALVKREDGALDKCLVKKENLEQFSFLISYSEWQETDGDVNTYCSHGETTWQSFLKELLHWMRWKLKRSAALPDNPRHNAEWMTGARKQTCRTCKTRQRISLRMPRVPACINSRGRMEFPLSVPVEKQKEVHIIIFLKKGEIVFGNRYNLDIPQEKQTSIFKKMNLF